MEKGELNGVYVNDVSLNNFNIFLEKWPIEDCIFIENILFELV